MFKISLDISKKELDKINKLGSVMRLGLLKGVKKSMIHAEGQAKKNFGGAGQLNVRSGHLRRSITSKVIDRGGGREITGVVGSNVVYAAIHEYGGPHPRSNTGKMMPARPFVGPAFNNTNMTKMKRIIQKEIATEVRRRQ